MDKPGLLGLGDEIKGVTFVPLEVTTDDASLIDGVYDYAVTDRYIYVLPVKSPVSSCSIGKGVLSGRW